jgi:hypothetical protein
MGASALEQQNWSELHDDFLAATVRNWYSLMPGAAWQEQQQQEGDKARVPVEAWAQVLE